MVLVPEDTSIIEVAVSSGSALVVTHAVPVPPPRPPIVIAIEPSHVAAAGGTVVKIIGNYFTPASTATIGGQPATVTLVESQFVLYVSSPPLAPTPSCDVVVTTVAGSSSGGAGLCTVDFSPSVVANLKLWLRADMGLTLNVGAVSQWSDQSGTGDTNKDQGQVLPGDQPVFSASDAAYNGQPTLIFDQIDDFLAASGNWASVVPAVATWFVVGQTANSANCFFLSNTGGTYEMFKVNNGAAYRMQFNQGATLFADFSPEETQKRIWCFEANGASSHIYRDSLASAATGNSGTNTALSMNVVGSGGALGGKIAEVIGYSGVLSLADRTAVMNYLATRYAVTLV